MGRIPHAPPGDQPEAALGTLEQNIRTDRDGREEGVLDAVRRHLENGDLEQALRHLDRAVALAGDVAVEIANRLNAGSIHHIPTGSGGRVTVGGTFHLAVGRDIFRYPSPDSRGIRYATVIDPDTAFAHLGSIGPGRVEAGIPGVLYHDHPENGGHIKPR